MSMSIFHPVYAFLFGVIVGSWLTQWAMKRWPPHGIVSFEDGECCDGNGVCKTGAHH